MLPGQPLPSSSSSASTGCWALRFKCEDCHMEVEQALGSSGQTGDDQQRRARKQVTGGPFVCPPLPSPSSSPLIPSLSLHPRLFLLCPKFLSHPLHHQSLSLGERILSPPLGPAPQGPIGTGACRMGLTSLPPAPFLPFSPDAQGPPGPHGAAAEAARRPAQGTDGPTTDPRQTPILPRWISLPSPCPVFALSPGVFRPISPASLHGTAGVERRGPAGLRSACRLGAGAALQTPPAAIQWAAPLRIT